MNSKETIIQATVQLIHEKKGDIDAITVREICRKANVGLGLLNYHFKNKDTLIETCVEQMIHSVVANFQTIRKQTQTLSPFEKLEFLGNMTLDFLFEHEIVSKISVLTDMNTPKDQDNTMHTYFAYLPLVAACIPESDEQTVQRKTFCLITAMQQAFLRHEQIQTMLGFDLTDKEQRAKFHSALLHDILGE